MKKENERMLLKETVIEGIFCVDGMEIAKIDNDFIGDDETLAFGRVGFEGYDYVLFPLTDEEYEKAAKQYLRLTELFS